MGTIDISLFRILRGYSSLTLPQTLDIPNCLSLAELQTFLLKLMSDPHLQSYPPSDQYQKMFWKWAIQVLEDMSFSCDSDEIDPRIYDHYLRLGSHGRSLISPGIPSQSYLTYYWMPSTLVQNDSVNLEKLTRVTLLESRTTIESGTTGLRTWKASFVLGDYLLNNPALVQGKNVLELGSGVGFLGTIVAAIQKSHMLPGTTLRLTDANEEALSRCRGNIDLSCNLSSSHPRVECRLLDWSLSLTRKASESCLDFLNGSSPDVILGADIVFDPSLIPALVGTLKLCLSAKTGNRSKEALIALTPRNCSTMALFIDNVKEVNLGIEELHSSSVQTSFSILSDLDNDNPVKIYRITD